MKATRTLLTLLIGIILLSPALAQKKLAAAEAKEHFGETATVCGAVVSTRYATSSKGQPTFLNLEKPYPNQIFTAIIFGNDRTKFGAPEISLREKQVCVTGEIFLYQGAPEIALRDPAQLSER